jgi:hypothetical protein
METQKELLKRKAGYCACYTFMSSWYRGGGINTSMVFFISFSPKLVLHHNKLKWIPLPTSSPLKSLPITMAEVQEATLTVLLPTPAPLTPPPIWRVEALEAILTALSPKCLTGSTGPRQLF